MQLSIRGKRCHAQSARPFRHRHTIIAARLLIWLLILPLIFCLAGNAALAQKSTTSPRPAWAQQPAQQKKVNDSTLMLLAGHPGTTYSAMAHDIATAMGASQGT